MATELSFREAFDKLAATLNDKNLGWIVAQVEEQILLGKPVPRRIKELKLTRHSTESPVQFRTDDEMKPGRALTEFRGTVGYTEGEQLKLLLSAIHYAIVSTSTLANVMSRRFPGMIFVSELGDHRFAAADLQQDDKLGILNRLKDALAELNAQLS